MKKILLGAVLASSLVMGSNLEKCSHAIEMVDKFYVMGDHFIKKDEEFRALIKKAKSKQMKSYFSNKNIEALENLNMTDIMQEEWKKVANVECRAIWGKNFSYRIYEPVK